MIYTRIRRRSSRCKRSDYHDHRQRELGGPPFSRRSRIGVLECEKVEFGISDSKVPHVVIFGGARVRKTATKPAETTVPTIRFCVRL